VIQAVGDQSHGQEAQPLCNLWPGVVAEELTDRPRASFRGAVTVAAMHIVAAASGRNSIEPVIVIENLEYRSPSGRLPPHYCLTDPDYGDVRMGSECAARTAT
jgi:hypothetical protein